MASLLKHLLGKREPAPVAASVPPGQRVYAIGDVHGRLDLLDALLARIDAEEAGAGPVRSTIIFLGDLIDRGPNSAGVVARALALEESGRAVRFIMGNHEEVFLAALEGREGAMRLFTRIGGEQTLGSYGIDEDAFLAASYDELVEQAQARVPAAHRAFLESFEDQIEVGDYLFVHAGIRPGVPLAEQAASDLRWIRDDFLNHAGEHGRIVVHGHTITEAVEERSNRIGIDTGAFASGRLTALGLEGSRRWFLTSLAS